MQIAEHETKRIVAVNFDSVIGAIQIENGEVTCAPEAPKEGVREALQNLSQDFRIIIYSRYGNYPGGREAIQAYLRYWDIPVDSVVDSVPPETRFVDWWAVPYTGKPELIPEQVRDFQAIRNAGPPRAGMRRCTGKQVGMAGQEEATGWFHGWMETSTVQGTCIVGLIEADDGKMAQCPVWTVRFLDR